MTVDLADYADALRREITPVGTDNSATVTDDMLLGYLTDAFWEARLDGFLVPWTADEDGAVTPVSAGGPDIPRQWIALVVIYAGVRVLRNQVLNSNSVFRAKAGPVEFETQSSSNMLTEMLKQLSSTKQRLYDELILGQMQTVYALDAVTMRVFGARYLHSGYQDTLAISPGSGYYG